MSSKATIPRSDNIIMISDRHFSNSGMSFRLSFYYWFLVLMIFRERKREGERKNSEKFLFLVYSDNNIYLLVVYVEFAS